MLCYFNLNHNTAVVQAKLKKSGIKESKISSVYEEKNSFIGLAPEKKKSQNPKGSKKVSFSSEKQHVQYRFSIFL